MFQILVKWIHCFSNGANHTLQRAVIFFSFCTPLNLWWYLSFIHTNFFRNNNIGFVQMKCEPAQLCLAENKFVNDKIPVCCFFTSAFMVCSSVRSIDVAEKGLPVL